jgi:hypothetical protein
LSAGFFPILTPLQLELILARFAQALPIEVGSTFWRWPFASLFMQLSRLSERIQSYEQQAQMTAEFRDLP